MAQNESNQTPEDAKLSKLLDCEFPEIPGAAALENLRTCFRLGTWRTGEAQTIFAGLVPAFISPPFTNRLEFLPGDNPLKQIPEDYDPANDFNYEATLDCMLRKIECVICGDSRTALEWLRIAKQAGLQIYWLDAALGDEECCQSLFGTADPVAIDKMLEVNGSQKGKDFQSAGGKAKNRKSDPYKALCILVRTFDEQYALDPYFDQASLSEKMKVYLATGPDALCADSSIATWMTEIRASFLSPEATDRIKDIRSANYHGHQSASRLLAEL